MSSDSNNSSSGPRLDRRDFLTGAAVTGAGLAVAGTLATRSAEAAVLFPNDPRAFGGGGSLRNAAWKLNVCVCSGCAKSLFAPGTSVRISATWPGTVSAIRNV